MALVFVSHAHGDDALARRLVGLLRDGLALDPGDFFVSSQSGRGVTPAAKVRDEILQQLATAPSLVVLVTPKSAGSPWVWLEAGNRLGAADKSNPLFVVPSERFVKLLQPVADLRCICLDREDELHELVGCVGGSIGRRPADVLAYNTALAELAAASRSIYSRWGEKRAEAGVWMRRHAAALVLAALALAALAAYGQSRVSQAQVLAAEAVRELDALRDEMQEQIMAANEAVNDEVSRTAARYLVLRGVVLSAAKRPIPRATVMASINVPAGPRCAEPACTSELTTTLGEFRLDLTKIQAKNGDDIVLSVRAPGFEAFSTRVRVDVRAMDVGMPSHTVALEPSQAPTEPES